MVEQRLAGAASSDRTARSTFSPRPPQFGQVPRIGTSSGTIRPRRASTLDSRSSVASTSAPASSPQKRVAHALDDAPDRREVDGDLVRETFLRRHRTDGVPDGAQRDGDETVRGSR